MNLYATPTNLDARAGAHNLASSALSLELLEAVSRGIDDFTGRHFHTETASRFFDVINTDKVSVDDMISVSELVTDLERDGTYDGETWVEDTDFFMCPHNAWPKTCFTRTPFGNFSLKAVDRYIKVTGEFGYGDGTIDPWDLLTATATVGDVSSKTITLSSSLAVVAGQTFKLESEQLFAEAVTTTVATCIRGVNGTTAAAHTAKAISIALYPQAIKRTAIQLAAELYGEIGQSGALQNERLGDSSYQNWASGEKFKRLFQMLGSFVRHAQ